MYTSWGKFFLVAVLMVAGDNFANFVTLQLGALLLSYSAVTVLLPQVGDPGDDSCQPVDKLMNRGLQRRLSIVFC